MEVLLADLTSAAHRSAIVEVLDMYSRNEFGDGRPLDASVKANLIGGLIAHGKARVYLACEGEVPAGLTICFVGFSTFKARPLLNVHDLAVAPEFRGRGIGKALLDAVSDDARRLGYCKVTLEVRADNAKALELYRRAGFCTSEPAEQWFMAKAIE
jgi:ribosomal protein S18 acetylase RimI-like enzyme